MRMSRAAFALAACVGLGAAVAQAQNIGSSLANTMDQLGWHVGGTLEVVSGGTFRLDTGTKTATAVAGAATLNKLSGVVTSEALSTAAAGTYVLTVIDSQIAATDLVFGSVSLGTSTTGLPDVTSIKPAAGSVVITVQNAGTVAFNGTLKIAFAAIKN